MGDWIQAHLVAAGLGAVALALPFLAPRLRKAIGSAIASALGKELKQALSLNSGDPKMDEKWKKWVLATTELAEYVIPDRGKGKERKAWVIAQAEKIVPHVAAELLGEMAEEAWESSDDVLKGTVKDNPPPPPSSPI